MELHVSSYRRRVRRKRVERKRRRAWLSAIGRFVSAVNDALAPALNDLARILREIAPTLGKLEEQVREHEQVHAMAQQPAGIRARPGAGDPPEDDEAFPGADAGEGGGAHLGVEARSGER